MGENRAFKGIWIPKEIWLSKELSIQEKVFLAEIESLDNEDGCFASNGYFSDFFGLSKNRCSEVIKGLEKKGYVTIKYIRSEGSKNIEKRVVMVVEKSIRYSESRGGYSESRQTYSESRRGYSGKGEGSNTFNNTDNNKDGDSGNFSKIFQAFEQNGFGTMNITTKDMILNLIDNYSGEWTLEAIEVAVESNVRNLRYVEGVLKTWRAEGKGKEIKTKDPYAGLNIY